ncbi:hypothetical protein [Streptomyces yangpuensis]|uniref:hypothetical protein n=1 Tax=Streptomyces yangpuensis TaxID=1648182 RepID=UPI0038194A87
MISTADELLAALAPLPHAARLRYTAITAHRPAARDGALRPLLTALDAGGPYERRLGALAALAGGPLGHLAARLADSDPVVRRYALRGARRLPLPDAAIEAAYDDAPAVVRADLARPAAPATPSRSAARGTAAPAGGRGSGQPPPRRGGTAAGPHRGRRAGGRRPRW